MTWLTRWRGLRPRGVLGLNARNTRCILDYNPRRRFPLADGKRARHELCGAPVMARLRLPTKLSGGRANLHQGAVGAGVDLATGVTTSAVLRDRAAERHADTGERVVGFRVPHWGDILALARTVSRAVGLGY